MFEQTFKNIDNTLRTEAGCQNELDYVEQTSWIIFLKYLDDLEADKEAAAELSGKKYEPILDAAYRWGKWAAPKTKAGELDHNKALTGDDLTDFVNRKLFPYLAKFRTTADHPDTIEYKIGEIFSEIRNKIQSGYNLREILNRVDELRFRSKAEKHDMSALYEDKIKNMGNAGRNGGEYYTPRPLIKAIVQVVAPKIGDRIYDPAVGSAGFLCEAYDYLKASKQLTTRDVEILQKKTFYGKEKKSLAYVIGTMNMILHGVEAPNIVHTNTLVENISDIQEKDRFDVILANPPFGGSEQKQVQQNFPIKSSETAYLFLQHFIKSLKAGGRAGIVIKNTFLSNTDNASVSLRKLLLESCDLHTILDCPSGTFQAAGVQTVVLFFKKGAPTTRLWYYKLEPGRNLGKLNPLNDSDLAEFIKLQAKKAETDRSWFRSIEDVNQETFDLSVKNPNERQTQLAQSPAEALLEISELDEECSKILASIGDGFLQRRIQEIVAPRSDWTRRRLDQICTFSSGGTPSKSEKRYWNGDIPWISGRDMKSSRLYDSLLHISESALKNSATRLAPVGSLLILVRGMGLAHGAQIGEVMLPCAFNQDIKAIHPNSDILPRFLLIALREHIDASDTVLSNAAHGTLKIDTEELCKIEIAYPSLERQQQIVTSIDEISECADRVRAICDQKLRLIDAISRVLPRSIVAR